MTTPAWVRPNRNDAPRDLRRGSARVTSALAPGAARSARDQHELRDIMSYYLGIDLGTTYTAAAVHDGSPRRAPEVVTLGERGPTVPSVLCLQPDGGFVAG